MLHVRLLAFSRIPIASRLACRASRRFASAQAAVPAAAASGVQLRDYQEECIQAVLSHLRRSHKRLGISLATGSGKTVIFTHLVDRIEPPAPGATRTLIIAHRRELVEQAAQHCMRAYPSKLVEIEMGNIHATGTADITVASVRSLCSGGRLLKYDARRFKLVLVDEAHHIVAPSYMDVLEHFGLKTVSAQSPALVGVSATLSRFDGLKLGAALDHIVYHKDYVEMIEDKWLANVIFTTVQSTADLSRVGTGAHGDFRPGELSRALNTPAVNDITVRTWLERASGGRRHSTLVFCADISHVTGLADAFRRRGIDARIVTGATLPRERSATLDAFRARHFPVLVNCGVFTEGTDIPGVDCVVLARPTRSRNLLVQMIGRGMRLHPGKTDCHIIDMVASLEAGIVTTPTLFGLEPDELLDAAGVEAIREKKAQREREAQMAKDAAAAAAGAAAAQMSAGVGTVTAAQAKAMARHHAERRLLSGGTSVTLTDYESVAELIGDTSGERHIRALSANAWVRIGADKYILKASSSGHSLTIERRAHDGWYEIVVRRRLSSLLPPGRGYGGADGSSSSSSSSGGDSSSGGVAARARKGAYYARPVRVGECETFLDAVHAADTYAGALFPRWSINKHERWRRLPATASQIAFLNRLSSGGAGAGGGGDDSSRWSADTLTKGKAMDMITKSIHGARGWFDEIQSSKRRELREDQRLDKAEALKLRERVTVGPVAA